MNIGWIGLGQIGLPMALRLLGAGHAVTAHSRHGERPELLEAGGQVVGTIAEAATQRDVVCVSVFDDAQVREAVLGEAGALRFMEPGSLLIIHTTGSPRQMRDLAARAAETGVAVVDATFSGDAAATAAGQLTIMIGGPAEAYQDARAVLSAYAAFIVHVGPVGSAQTLKLINNALFASQLRLAVEALRLAESACIEGGLAAKTLARSSGGSYAMNGLANNYPLDSYLARLRRYLDKDLKVAAAAAKDAGIDMDVLLQAAAYQASEQEK